MHTSIETTSPSTVARPVVFEFEDPRKFLVALAEYLKSTSKFSVRRNLAGIEGCSASLVTQVLAGKRRLTRDQLPAFAKIFKLTSPEFEYLDQLLRKDLWAVDERRRAVPRKRQTRNHILSSWLNIYVKDLVNLKGFTLQPQVLHRMLLGLALPKAIDKSVDFLLREGFWRRTVDGRITPEEEALISTNEIPNEKIRLLHKQALKIALRGMSAFEPTRRKSSTVLISVDRDKFVELRGLVDEFQNKLLKFIEDNPSGKDELVQIITHLTPVGVKNE